MLRWLWGLVVAPFVTSPVAAEPVLERLEVPQGFKVELFADGVTDARSMALGDEGTLFVGTRNRNVVYAITHDGTRATKVRTIAKGLNSPNGVAFRDGALYVAEIGRVLRYDGIEAALDAPPEPVIVTDAFPEDGHHGWKYIAFGPDGLLYVPVGAPCNICEPAEQYAAIFRMKPDGTALEPYASGVRNTVGFDWDASGTLWFTDNGRDWLGDDTPPCELNRAPQAGLDFGYPRCHGSDVVDPEFGGERGCEGSAPPAVEFGAHTAPLGIRFYDGALFPAEYRGDAFVAQHGSWNRSKKAGYQVLRVPIDGGKAGTPEPFLTGFLREEKVSGRPVDLVVMPDGALLVSDDQLGVIYRVGYSPP